MTDYKQWVHPLLRRYASKAMLQLLSPFLTVVIMRQLWTRIADHERELGIESITEEAIRDLEANQENIDFERIDELEGDLRHDVVANSRAFEEVAPAAQGQLHGGMTSCDVTDPTEQIIYGRAIQLLESQAQSLARSIIGFGRPRMASPTLGFTHGQPAFLTTWGKRSAVWLHELWRASGGTATRQGLMLDPGHFYVTEFRGIHGAVGTDNSMMALFHGDEVKVDELNLRVARDFGYDSVQLPICTQTYSRIIDAALLNNLALVGAACYRIANDIRLLQSHQIVREPFSEKQKGSSVMTFKRNPMLCERICALARVLMGLAATGLNMAAGQWLERSLDDSATRRIIIAEALLLTDSILVAMRKVFEGLTVVESVDSRLVQTQAPFLVVDVMLAEAVQRGLNRTAVYDALVIHTKNAWDELLATGTTDLFGRLRTVEVLAPLQDLMVDISSAQMTGRATQQASNFFDLVEASLPTGVPQDQLPLGI